MGTFNPAFIPYDADGRDVSLDSEYMYRFDGSRLKVRRFEYYRAEDCDYNWFILASEDSSNAINVDRYKVSELYITKPSLNVLNKQCVIDDLNTLKHKLNALIVRLGFDKDLYDILRDYALDILDMEPVNFVGYNARTALRIILTNLQVALYDIAEKIEDLDA